MLTLSSQMKEVKFLGIVSHGKCRQRFSTCMLPLSHRSCADLTGDDVIRVRRAQNDRVMKGDIEKYWQNGDISSATSSFEIVETVFSTIM